DPTRTLSGTLGTDAKLGLTQDLVLSATINPDFGQVEVDPSVINLSTIEPFFPEHRPFFLEGSELFGMPLQIVHTRRIGATPSIPNPVHPGGSIATVDQTATIWGATKVSGRIGSMSVLLLDAVTNATTATESYPGATGQLQSESHMISPITNWFAARVRGPV